MQGIRRICAESGRFFLQILAISALTALFSACQPAAESADEPVSAPELQSTASMLPDAASSASCGEQGYLSIELFGALAGEFEWVAAELECEGMPRPDGDGARLRFAGNLDSDHQLAFIIALPTMQRGVVATELQSKVTVIEEGAGRFFTTGDNDICWTDIVEFQQRVDSETHFTVAGTLYCVAPLVEVNGDSDLTFRDFRFRGELEWNVS